MNADITIRELTAEDYSEVSQGYQRLHKLHVEGRADIYKDMEQPFFGRIRKHGSKQRVYNSGSRKQRDVCRIFNRAAKNHTRKSHASKKHLFLYRRPLCFG